MIPSFNYSAKKVDKSQPQTMQSNNWVTNGTLGSKDAVLVFRTSVLAANATPSHSSTSSTIFEDPYSSETPSTSSTCAETTTLSLPKNFNFIEKKSKKRCLESSSSTSSSSSSSLNSTNSVEIPESNIDLTESSTSSKNVETDEKSSENKENIIVQPLDKEDMPAAIFNISYKFMNTETRLLRKILNGHGMVEIGHEQMDFNLLWTGNQLKPDMLRNLSPFQRINHFPR